MFHVKRAAWFTATTIGSSCLSPYKSVPRLSSWVIPGCGRSARRCLCTRTRTRTRTRYPHPRLCLPGRRAASVAEATTGLAG
jgi:hypothetical protein